ncbi:MAG: hypothetical protein R3E01_19795 [Pirellulaceae bacterium]
MTQSRINNAFQSDDLQSLKRAVYGEVCLQASRAHQHTSKEIDQRAAIDYVWRNLDAWLDTADLTPIENPQAFFRSAIRRLLREFIQFP